MTTTSARRAGGLAAIAQPATLREHNRALILNVLHRAEALSRADLARELGFAGSTVSRLVDELVGTGLIEEYGKADPNGGRPGTMLRLRREGAYALGADLSRQGIRVVVADLHAKTLADAEREHGETPEDDIAIVAHEVGRLLSELNVDRERVIGMGIGVPGQVDTGEGLVLDRPNYPGWSFLPVRDRLTALLGMPVLVENNANAAAYGEYLARHDVRTLLYAHAGAGVGAGMVLNGQIHRGRTNAAGHIGHVTIRDDGPVCQCGRRGCLVTLASTEAMAEGLLGTAPGGSGFARLLAAEAAGDASAHRVLVEGGHAFGLALGNLIEALDPDLIVLGGQAVTSDAYREAAVDEMRARPFADGDSDIHIEVSPAGPNAVAHGAAVMLLQRLFDSPLA